ncbi:hypothetical protein HPE56_08495 [Maribacter sp. ANRC-HE7]|uniref:Uncharacterized protein n=1 Tax=Maribacter aquimaris TaxID=2737171 RepID=A0ABR7V1M3_9FLAO|nr:hypothetical protein [Maribacter aquimaris]MBD0777830.1 hypothetical protein [Maribacter aquimaris]
MRVADQVLNDKIKVFIIPTGNHLKNVVTIDEASVLDVGDNGSCWRLPKGDGKFTTLADNRMLRLCREVATECDLFNCSGTFMISVVWC